MSPTSTGHRTWLASALLLLATLMLACPVPAHATTVAGSIPVGTNPQRAVITPNGAEVYVSNLGSNNVSVIDTATNTLTHTIPVGLEPDALAVSPDGSKVYVGEHLENVSVIDTATKAVSTIATGLPVRDLAITPDSQNVYLAMEFSGLRKIVTSNNTVSTVSGAVCPEAVVVTPAGARAYVNYQCAPPPGTGGHDPIYLFDVAPIQAHPEHSRREGRPQLADHPPQHPAGAPTGRRVARPQHGRDRKLLRLVVEGHGGHEGQIAPRVVVAVEKGELLLPVGGVVGGIEVDRDAGGPSPEPPPMVVDDRIGQHVSHADQLPPPYGVLEARERGLRAQGGASERVPVEQELVERVVGQPGGVVAVGIPAGQAEDPLPEQLDPLVPDLARLTGIAEARHEALGHPQRV